MQDLLIEMLTLAESDTSRNLTPPDGCEGVVVAWRGVLFSKQWGVAVSFLVFVLLLFFQHFIIGIIFQHTKL